MSARILLLPQRQRDQRGTVHVIGDQIIGFEIGHESSSGKHTYSGTSDVLVCDAVVQDATDPTGHHLVPGDFGC